VVRVRRLHAQRKSGLQICAPLAAALDSDGSRAVTPDLAREAAIAELSLQVAQLPSNVAAVWRAGSTLQWSAASGTTQLTQPGPAPLLDLEIAAMRQRFPQFADVHGQNDEARIDENPLGRVIFHHKRALVFDKGQSGRALDFASWQDIPQLPAWCTLLSSDRIQLRGPGNRIYDLGPGKSPVVIANHVLWNSAGKLRARQLNTVRDSTATTSAADLTEELNFGAGMVRYSSCRNAQGSTIAVETDSEVFLFALGESSMRRIGHFAMPHPAHPAVAGALGLTCGADDVRVAWAVSEPPGDATVAMNGATTLPAGDRNHHIMTQHCSQSGCVANETRVHNLDIGWVSMGGWSSPMYLQAPEVYDLGTRLLLIWANGSAIQYRLAAPPELNSALSQWLVEQERPEQSEVTTERTLAWPRYQVHAEPGVALVLLTEWGAKPASYFLRIDAAGDARVMAPPD
jgi:hypothetical protein